jgi:flagellar assembly factor FliW
MTIANATLDDQTPFLPDSSVDPHQSVVSFPHGLPGFAECRSFVLFAAEAANFQWLTSVEGPAAAFLTVDPRHVEPSLHYELTPADQARLGTSDSTPLLWLAIVLVEADGTVAVNLRAPIVINPTTLVGHQIMPQRTLYPIRHVISGPSR